MSFVEVVLAAIGLVGGGYAGGRLAAVARMRLEDRRHIYDRLLPLITEVPTALNEATLDNARRYSETMRTISRIVDISARLDRWTWRRVHGHAPRGALAYLDNFLETDLKEQSFQSVSVDSVERSLADRRRTPTERSGATGWAAAIAEWTGTADEVRYRSSLLEMSEYLRWRLRPSWTHRWRIGRHWFRTARSQVTTAIRSYRSR